MCLLVSVPLFWSSFLDFGRSCSPEENEAGGKFEPKLKVTEIIRLAFFFLKTKKNFNSENKNENRGVEQRGNVASVRSETGHCPSGPRSRKGKFKFNYNSIKIHNTIKIDISFIQLFYYSNRWRWHNGRHKEI